MKLSTAVFAACVLFVVGVSGCNSAKKDAPAPQAQPGVSQAQPGVNPAQSPAVALSGKVVETMNSGGYTYLCVENAGNKTWVAIPNTPVKVGQMVTCQPGMVMNNFTSKTLNRTFESIIFSAGIR